MREKFWKKLKKDQRNFKWFYDNYIRYQIGVGVQYNTLYQQAKGEMLKSMDLGLKLAIKRYLSEM